MIDLIKETKQLFQSMPSPRLEIFHSPQDMAIEVANEFARELDPKIKERRIKVKQLYLSGLTNTYKLAKEVGSTRGSVYQDLRSMGLKPKEKKDRWK